ncbi:MAG: tyrosine-type recombinase/integrase [Planctomycetota bacterium]|nr:tyrosine-type recombinase/integrase [Planctomycetota bacterium]
MPRPVNEAPPDEPAPEEGTVWHFYRTVYAPQRLIEVTETQRAAYERIFRFMREHFGRDLLLTELSDSLAADFLGSQSRKNKSPGTVNHHRSLLLAVWRFAFDSGLVSALPRIKKLKQHWDEPDSWSEQEAARIVEAAGKLELMPIYGIPANKWWRAFLLVAYWTALRRGSLLELRRADVDLQSGWLYVRPVGIKTRRGKRFRLGADAVAAIREIWLPERELLFPWRKDRGGTGAHFNRILELAGVPRSHRTSMNQTHKWRRTVATLAAIRGGLSAAVALLGHSGPEMTRRYIDPTKLPGNDATQFLAPLALSQHTAETP